MKRNRINCIVAVRIAFLIGDSFNPFIYFRF